MTAYRNAYGRVSPTTEARISEHEARIAAITDCYTEISELARRATLPALEILYPCVDPRGQSARTLDAAKLAAPVSEASAYYRSPVVTRSHRHHSEAK